MLGYVGLQVSILPLLSMAAMSVSSLKPWHHSSDRPGVCSTHQSGWHLDSHLSASSVFKVFYMLISNKFMLTGLELSSEVHKQLYGTPFPTSPAFMTSLVLSDSLGLFSSILQVGSWGWLSCPAPEQQHGD